MNEIVNFTDVRLFYTKTGSAKYISHLDVMRAFQRALKRSKIDFWYTEGFHPHLYLTFALPLSLGYESTAETVDFRIVSPLPYDEITRRIDAVLPVGFKAVAAAKPVMDAKRIKFAEYKISFSVPEEAPEEVLADWYRCFSRESVIVTKKTKRGENEIDIKPHVRLSKLVFRDGRFYFNAVLSAGTELNINPELLFEAFRVHSKMKPEEISVLRIAVYNEKMENFR